ncbi:MAG: hypothetical protein DMF21_02795 [Verrucomicrobia bacterium]|nr:MAG: hypothetical protein DMF21_02795 [Verrucomicrobiota bacterium]
MKMEHSLTLHNGEQLNFGFYGDVCRGKEEPLVPELNGEAESNKRFFEELIQERVLNLKYGGQSRRNRCGDLIFVRDGNEYWYLIRDGLSTIDNETFAYVQELATKAGIGVVVESDNSPATRETTK